MTPFQQHSVLDPVGPQAARVVTLWHQILLTAAIVFVLVTIALLAAVWHRRRNDGVETLAGDRKAGRVIAGATGLTVLTLLLFVAASFWTDRVVAAPPRVPPLHIHVTAHQWWWQVDYVDSIPADRISTANEIHVPIRRPVVLELTSNDVIHSFWVPDVQGKQDLIPGRTNWLSFEVDSAGVYRGNCAEFCGLEHAKMGILIIADAPDAFQAWAASARRPAPSATDTLGVAGIRVFIGAACVLCHTVQGTAAHGQLGPDLSHFGSRHLIAAGTLTNTPDHLAQWITETSTLKPGVLMPPTRFDPAELRTLVTWLESLR